MMVIDEHIVYKCRKCNKVYKTFARLIQHKRLTDHLGIEVVELSESG